MLYVLVCGSLPFDGPSLPALRQRVTEGRFRIPFFMSQGVHYPDNPSQQLLLITNSAQLSHSQRLISCLCPADCENLIRKMLVVDPAKRISVAQIKQHRWMLADPTAAHQTLSHSLTEYNSNLGDYSEPVLGIMNTLGIDRQRTIEVTEQMKAAEMDVICHYKAEKVNKAVNSLNLLLFFLSLCRAAATITSLLFTTCCWRE